MPPQDNISILHQSLMRDNFDVPQEESVFRKNLLDKGKASQLYAKLKENNYDVPDSPVSFYDKLFPPQKKSPDSTASSVGSSGPVEGSLSSVNPVDQAVLGQVKPGSVTPDQEAQLKENLTRDKKDNGVSALESASSTFDKAVLKPFLVGIPQSFAIGFNKLTGGNLDDDLMYQTTKWLEKQGDIHLPENPIHKESLLTGVLPDVAGTLTSFWLGGAAGRTAKVADLAIPSASRAILNETAKHVPAAFMASASTASEAYNQAVASGAPQEKAYEAWEKTMASGVPFLISPTTRAFNKLTNGALKYGIIEGAKGGVTGMFQLASSKALENLGAQETYDETRKITDGVLDAGGSGFAINGVLTGVLAALAHKRIVAPGPKIDEAWSYVKEKQKQLQDQNIKNTDFYRAGSAPIEMVQDANGTWSIKNDANGPTRAKESAQALISAGNQRAGSDSQRAERGAAENDRQEPARTNADQEVDKGRKDEKQVRNNVDETRGVDSAREERIQPDEISFAKPPARGAPKSVIDPALARAEYENKGTGSGDVSMAKEVLQGEPGKTSEPATSGTENIRVADTGESAGGLRSDADIEKRMSEIEGSKKDFSEFRRLEKEMERRERDSIFSVPLSEATAVIAALIKKNKELPNGYTASMETEEGIRAKRVIERYLDPASISDASLKNDFKGAMFGRPDSWYPDGLRLRESVNLAAKRGISLHELIRPIENEFVNDGYSKEDAANMIADRLKSINAVAQDVQPEVKTVESVTSNIPNKTAESVQDIEPVRNPQIEETTPEAKNGTTEKANLDTDIGSYKTGDEVGFEHVSGFSGTGKIEGYENGKYKIRAKHGTVYHVKPSGIQDDSKPTPYTADQPKTQDKVLSKAAGKYKRNAGKSGIAPVSLAPVGAIFRAIRSGLTGINQAQERTIGRGFKALEEWAAKQVNTGVSSRHSAVRNSSEFLRSIIGGLPYSGVDLKSKLKFTGGKNYAGLRPNLLAQEQYKIVDSDATALAHVHEVLDPKYFHNPKAVGKIDYNNLNSAEKALFDQLRQENDFIHEWSFRNGFISPEKYAENKGKYVPRMYEEYELMPEEIENAYKKTRADFNMFKARKDNDLKLLEDPVYLTNKRLGQVMMNQAIMDYAEAIVKNGKVKVSDTEFPGSIQLGEPGGKPYYGKLTGKYVPQYIAEDFKGIFYTSNFMQKAYDWFRAYDNLGIRQFLKKSHTVYSPNVQLGNFTNNFVFAFMSGIDPITFSGNMISVRNDVKNKTPFYEKAVKEGLIGTDIATNDLKSIHHPEDQPGVGFFGKLKDAFKVFDKKAMGAYSGADDLAKMAAYKSFLDAGYSDEEALQKVYEGFQNYATVGKAYDFSSKTPVIGPVYGKFKPDMARIIKNAATRRPLNAIAFVGFLTAMANMFSNKSDEPDDIQEARESRKFIPKINLPNAVGGDVPLVWQIPEVGEVNIARFMTPFYEYDKDGSALESISAYLPYQLSERPSVASKDPTLWVNYPDVLLGVVAQVAEDVDFRGKSIRDPKGNKNNSVATNNEKIANDVNYIMRSTVPFWKNSSSLVNAFLGQPDDYDRIRTVRQAWINNVVKIQEFGDPEVKNYFIQEMTRIANDISSTEKDIGAISREYEKDIMRVQGSKILSEDARQKQLMVVKETFDARVAAKTSKIKDLVKELEKPKEVFEKLAAAHGW